MHQEKATLQRQLKPMHVWAVAFGCIVGWGSFINPGKKFLPNSGVAGTAIAMALGASRTGTACPATPLPRCARRV